MNCKNISTFMNRNFKETSRIDKGFSAPRTIFVLGRFKSSPLEFEYDDYEKTIIEYPKRRILCNFNPVIKKQSVGIVENFTFATQFTSEVILEERMSALMRVLKQGKKAMEEKLKPKIIKGG